MSNGKPSDPMEFLRNLWGGNGFSLPGMVTPTLDTEELEKQIRDLKTVEGWLRTNLSMLSMTIQNLEMQRTTITAVKTMSQMYADQSSGNASPSASAAAGSDGLAQAAMWPWNMVQQMQETMQNAAAEAGNAAAEAAKAGVARATSAAESAAGDAKAAAARRKKTS